MNRPRLPTLIFEVTQDCNHTCRHCYNVWHPAGGYPTGALATADTLALLAKVLDEADCSHVTLSGGEPLLRADLPVLVDFLRTRGVRCSLISNGRLLTEQAVVDLLERGVGLFELPLLGATREVHDYLSGCEGAFDAVLSAMAHIRYHRGQFVAVFVATRLNLPDLYDAVKLASAFGAGGLLLNRFNPGGRGRQHLAELLPTVGQVRRALEVANAASVQFRLPISCSIPIQPCLIDTGAYRNLTFGFCAAGSQRAYYTLDALGNVRPCNHTPTILGNLCHERLAALVSPERLSSFVKARPASCAGCRLEAACQGGCKAAAQVCYGSLDAEEPFLHRNRGRRSIVGL